MLRLPHCRNPFSGVTNNFGAKLTNNFQIAKKKN